MWNGWTVRGPIPHRVVRLSYMEVFIYVFCAPKRRVYDETPHEMDELGVSPLMETLRRLIKNTSF